MPASLRCGSGTAASSASTSAGLSPLPAGAAAAVDRRCGRHTCRRGGRGVHSRWITRSDRAQIDRRCRVIKQLLRTIQTDALSHAGQRLQHRGKPLRNGR